MQYSRIPRGLYDQLLLVPPSHDRELEYRPCQVLSTAGELLHCVYVVEERQYFRHWRTWPEDDPHKRHLLIDNVSEISESPFRLPARFADQLYKAGESFMGGCIFRVRFRDGTSQTYATGNAVDFVPYPSNYGKEDVISVNPHEGRTDPGRAKGLDYYWCLYSIELQNTKELR
jgi:hypothetical protein